MFPCPSMWQNGLQASNSLQRCWLLLNKAPHWFKSSRLLATGSTTEPPDRGSGQQKFTSMPSESCFMSQRQPRRGGTEGGERRRAVTPSSLATHSVKNTVFLRENLLSLGKTAGYFLSFAEETSVATRQLPIVRLRPFGSAKRTTLTPPIGPKTKESERIISVGTQRF